MEVRKTNLEAELLKMTSTLYNNSVVPRNVVQFFLSTLMHVIHVVYFSYVKEQLILSNVNKGTIDKFDRILVSSMNIFDKFKSEHSRFALCIEKGLMIMPKEYQIVYKLKKSYV